MDETRKIGVVEFDSEDYPAQLRLIKDPPEKLYYIGDLQLASREAVSVVGSRKASPYGGWAAEEISRRLAASGLVVVSGMAAGIDSISHKGALAAGGATVAVLGCGIDICFPAFNRNLRNEIGKKGLLLSEYPPGVPGSRYTFPQRNRIISGLSLATVIVEAGVNSGSLITAERAVEQGRQVFALPGNINSFYSIGTNKLIQDGAYPLAFIDDIFDVLGLPKKDQQQRISGLGVEEQRMVEAVCQGGEVTVDSLCRTLGMKVWEVNSLLTILEMKGVVYSALGKIFIAN
ncbi:DNA-protecting protein DprA [Aminipila butyrica]|uniref:DNA-protecting protein DprA n=1 Tax=Aminipila butyrica TaxID=433296 RepID=A0A858BYJ6_9FIRM|nr:DNA-processing protein DprA [Aminipila butyrica]QIB69970.1 DNA-protecting protein DprA [Aminipila butyrica]